MTTLAKESRELDVVQRMHRREPTVTQAAQILSISEPQCRGVTAHVGKVGAKGVLQGNRGQPCKRKLREKAVERMKARQYRLRSTCASRRIWTIDRVSRLGSRVCRTNNYRMDFYAAY